MGKGKNRENSEAPARVPPSSSSSKGEEDESSSNEEHTKQQPQPQPQPQPPSKECESESDSDSDSEPPKKSAKQASPSQSQTISRFKRVWSLEDEVVLLKALLAYQQSQGRRISATQNEMRAFHPTLAGSITFNVNTSQLYKKVRHLKERYQKAFARAANKGNMAPTFSNAHNGLIYTLSQKIWAGDKAPRLLVVGGKKNRAAGKYSSYPCLKDEVKKMENSQLIKAAMEKINPKDLASLETKLQTVESDAIKIQIRKMQLFKHIHGMVLQVLDESSS